MTCSRHGGAAGPAVVAVPDWSVSILLTGEGSIHTGELGGRCHVSTNTASHNRGAAAGPKDHEAASITELLP